MGAPGRYNDGVLGFARVYQWNSLVLDYEQIGRTLNGQAPNDYFGWKVAVSPEGGSIAVGAPGHDVNGESSGQTMAYDIVLT